MKLRLAGLGDAEYADTDSARECRILLRALARDPELVVMWFALGSTVPPHLWHGVRVFPIPAECAATSEFLETLISQQRPHVVLSNLRRSSFPAAFEHLAHNGVPWLHRFDPDDQEADGSPPPAVVLVADEQRMRQFSNARHVPYLRGLQPGIHNGGDATAVLESLRRAIAENTSSRGLGSRSFPTHLVMRQHLFCNTSLAQVMFELTNSLIELGVPTVPQDEHARFAKEYIQREEELFQRGARQKYERIRRYVDKEFDPENAVTVHFTLLAEGLRYSQQALFPSLAGQEVLYVTGNHTVQPEGFKQLMRSIDRILAPSRHVLQPYLEAGLSPRHGTVIPHGIDPWVYAPEVSPFA